VTALRPLPTVPRVLSGGSGSQGDQLRGLWLHDDAPLLGKDRQGRTALSVVRLGRRRAQIEELDARIEELERGALDAVALQALLRPFTGLAALPLEDQKAAIQVP
jgi:hypothetical protein